jgi:Protein of unknown function (DUF3570)
VAATSLAPWLRGWLAYLRARHPGGLLARLAGLAGGVLAGGSAAAIELPADRADTMYHRYDGGGLVADGPALLVRKSLARKVSLSAQYYVDMVSNASIDVVTTASPFKEQRDEYSVGVDYAYRDALVSLSGSSSKEPDYTADGVSFDVTQEVFGGMTTIVLGFSRGSDKVGKKNAPEFSEVARHWRYRTGITQILTPRWLAGVNIEAVSDDGYLGSPYRSARVFGAAVPERIPRSRSSRSIRFRGQGDLGARNAVAADYRYFWDNWGIRAHSLSATYSRYFGEKWLADAGLRIHRQDRAVFYSDNFTTETTFISRARQLSTFSSFGPNARLSYLAKRVPGSYEMRINGSYELLRFKFDDFTDLRNGKLFEYDAHVLQLSLSANF